MGTQRRDVTVRIPVYVHATDPISRAGVAGHLRPRPEVEVLDDSQFERAQVAVVVTDTITDETVRVLRELRCAGVRRRVQRQMLGPRGLTFSGLAEREIEVLKLVADGFDTAEIATKLSYSQRTVKNVLHDVTSRLHLRNRSHAVAYALRHGLI
jgi:DNA-binding CsgD family transcriptional regulator